MQDGTKREDLVYLGSDEWNYIFAIHNPRQLDHNTKTTLHFILRAQYIGIHVDKPITITWIPFC